MRATWQVRAQSAMSFERTTRVALSVVRENALMSEKSRSRTVGKHNLKTAVFWSLVTLALVVAIGGYAFVESRGSADTGYVSTYVPVERQAPVQIDMSRVNTAILIGDSWTEGTAASPKESGFAYLLGGKLGIRTKVVGFSGSGYMNPNDRGVGTFAQRWSRIAPDFVPDLVVVTGSINDLKFDPADVYRAAGDFYGTLRFQFPNAQLLVIGPTGNGPDTANGLKGNDFQVASAAVEAGAQYISPLTETWFNVGNYGQYFEQTVSPHPNNAGHEYFADRISRVLTQTD
ncbi:MAG: SGNH/GDSL hydrolase family protein [Alcaligenaceae bacterium]|nr:MAG: SGNH/GDSL hydrolase family protein [Alcaligenaceae bacterium]